jgi:hypothetical protein
MTKALRIRNAAAFLGDGAPADFGQGGSGLSRIWKLCDIKNFGGPRLKIVRLPLIARPLFVLCAAFAGVLNPGTDTAFHPHIS